jgi:hypothetical protein
VTCLLGWDFGGILCGCRAGRHFWDGGGDDRVWWRKVVAAMVVLVGRQQTNIEYQSHAKFGVK